MPELDANVARYHFKAAVLPADTFSVVSFSGKEQMSGLFRYEIVMVSDDPQIDFNDIVNKRAKFSMLRGSESLPISGIVSELKQGSRIRDYYYYTAVLVPSIRRLALNYRSRIFQKKKVDEIVKQILDDNGFAPADYRFELSRSLTAREYCVQHQESDLDFVSRLLEHEGIYYFFEFEEERDCLVMVDDRQKHSEIGGEDVLQFHEGEGMIAENPDSVVAFVPQHQIVTGKVVLNDYNYRTPQSSLKVESQLNGEMPGEHYEYGNHFEDSGEGNALAKIRNEEIECDRVVLDGESVCMGLRSGFLFTLEQHFRRSLNGEEYLLFEVAHEGSQKRALSMELGFRLSDEEEDEDDELYSNVFRCIPATVQFRPARRTAKPKMSGIMTGKVESAGGDYAFIDDEGRYRAKMHFDIENPATAEASRPIRMSQPHAGPEYGMHFPLHADAEVAWACVNGDIDRPIIIGSVPNPSQKSPSLAENKMQNVVRTKAGNQMVLDDTIDKAQILINTPDANRMLFDDAEDAIIVETTNKHKVTLDDKNKRIEVKTTNGHFVLMQDGGAEKEGKITVQSEAGHRISINDKDELITLVDESGDNIFQIDIGNKKLTIKTVDGDIEMLAENGTIDIKATTLNVETSADTNVTAGGKIVSEATMDHEMKANNIKMEASMNFEQKAGIDLKSEAGLNHGIKGSMVKSEGSGTNDVAGAAVSLKGSAAAIVSGAIVKIN